ncbi:AAA family ATPase [Fibrella sp. HMF5335]|uniref:AAA family ATPase n=1 Tax=Fibrella rubiginis TaxID=2817060 RepID=A0A939GCL3_9BACT|nr:AAA family ATPase [Fibrella rubiginis]MBO0936469.1 AAA family ATPase [Fibrella rubiginis]
MPAIINFSVPTLQGDKSFEIETGSSLLIVGANGSGKTRLAAHIENALGLNAHRISAHRALSLNPSIAKINLSQAMQGLRIGMTDISEEHSLMNRPGQRWRSNQATSLLNDYDYLVQALFAEQSITALETHKRNREGYTERAKETNFEKLKSIWEALIPHRTLLITGDNITVSGVGVEVPYKAGDMSDGERAVFYLIGQTLCAKENSLLIFDEPELHIHRAIMSKLWDALEASRSDCAFILISHDLEFVASRTGQKYVIRDYNPTNIHTPIWTIDEVPQTGFTEEITTKILGSRKPILFVEGATSSLDYAIYRNCYSQWTVIPRNSCEEVIHAVVTMRNNASLTRVTCAGLVDADDYEQSEIDALNTLGIRVLPVSEIENLFLLPSIAKAVGTHEGYVGHDLNCRVEALNDAIIVQVQKPGNIEAKVAQYCRRRIDRILKKIDLSKAISVADIVTKYAKETSSLDVQAIANKRRSDIQECIDSKNIPKLLSLYDDKGLVALVAQHMKATRKNDFESWFIRALGNNSVPGLVEQFKITLPVIYPS